MNHVCLLQSCTNEVNIKKPNNLRIKMTLKRNLNKEINQPKKTSTTFVHSCVSYAKLYNLKPIFHSYSESIK